MWLTFPIPNFPLFLIKNVPAHVWNPWDGHLLLVPWHEPLAKKRKLGKRPFDFSSSVISLTPHRSHRVCCLYWLGLLTGVNGVCLLHCPECHLSGPVLSEYVQEFMKAETVCDWRECLWNWDIPGQVSGTGKMPFTLGQYVFYQNI